ncbi:baseplate protein [Vibrio parahaemolyticus]|nr:baseplate protein [Vibrio parahaemolyticus]HBN6266229.1 baseplate protein [Vibrio parahaemolyticus]
MAGHLNTIGNRQFVKAKYKQNLAAGEKLSGAEFEMTFDEYPDISVLIRSTQLAANGTADVEDFGPMGMKFTQHGPYENNGEIAVTAVETITGAALAVIKDIVKEKKYVTVRVRATPESTAGISPDSLDQKYEDCKLRSDVIDLSTEDTAALVKPAMTIIYNWKD